MLLGLFAQLRSESKPDRVHHAVILGGLGASGNALAPPCQSFSGWMGKRSPLGPSPSPRPAGSGTGPQEVELGRPVSEHKLVCGDHWAEAGELMFVWCGNMRTYSS